MLGTVQVHVLKVPTELRMWECLGLEAKLKQMVGVWILRSLSLLWQLILLMPGSQDPLVKAELCSHH